MARRVNHWTVRETKVVESFIEEMRDSASPAAIVDAAFTRLRTMGFADRSRSSVESKVRHTLHMTKHDETPVVEDAWHRLLRRPWK